MFPWRPSKMSKFLRVAGFMAGFGGLRQFPYPAFAEARFRRFHPQLSLRALDCSPSDPCGGGGLPEVLCRPRLGTQFLAEKINSFSHGGSSLVGRRSDGFVGGGGDGGAVPDNVRRENFIADEALFEAKAEAGRERPEVVLDGEEQPPVCLRLLCGDEHH